MSDFDEFESQLDDSIMAEFLLDSDEGSPLPDRPHSPYAMAADDTSEDYGSPSEALGLVSNGSQSMNSSYGSMLGSQSSKGTPSTASTSLTGNGAGAMMDWDVAHVRGDAPDGLSTMGSTFKFTSASATVQPDLCGSPGPFTSGLNGLPPDTTNPFDFAAPHASTQSEVALSSFRTSCGGGLQPFAFGPTTPGAVSGALTEAPSASPTALCMRPSQSIPPLFPGYAFRGSQDEAGTIATNTSETFGMSQSAAGQVVVGNPFNGVALAAPVPRPFDFSPYGPRFYGLDVDASNSKSRVETQIAIKLRMPHLPPGIKKLHLPKHTISKPKFWTKPPAGPSPNMLELHAVLVCTSAMQVESQRVAALQRAQLAARSGSEYSDSEELKPQDGGEVQICENCIGRERKRAGRKKLKNLEDELAWEKDEARRVIVFNTHEIKDWTPHNAPDSVAPAYFQVDVPMRIACYCRHHAEKLGFQIIFTLTDYSGQVVDQTLSPSIMITDDHKSTSPRPVPGSRARKPSPTQQDTPAQDATYSAISSLVSSPSLDKQALRRSSASSTSIPDLQQVGRRGSSDSTSIAAMPTDPLQPTVAAQPRKNSSRPPSPSLSGAPAKRRKAKRSVPRVSSDLAMTRLDTAVPRGPQLPTPTTSPFLPNPPATFTRTAVPPTFGDGTTAPREPLTGPFGNGPQTAGSNGQLPFSSLSRTASLSNPKVPAFGPPASARPNPAASPHAPRPSPPLPTNGEARTPQTQVQPAIFKVIPEQGSVMGGTETTLIGLGFHKDMHVMFGDRQSTVTTHWSSGTLTCIVPPSDTGGVVQVTLRGPNAQPLAFTPERFFRYVDDSDQQLLRTALMILNMRMGGWRNVDDFARQVLSDSRYPSPGREMAALEGSSGRAGCDFENQLLKVLELMHQGNTTRMPRLNLRRMTGHTMLHLACKLGLQRFVARLLERGAHADLRDNGGYTALHMASISNHAGIVRLLMSYGADPTLRTLSGLTAHDVATSDQVRHVLDCFERRRRSQSSSKAHSRVNSAVSLESLRAAQVLTSLSRSQPAIGGASGDESELEDESPESEEAAYESGVADASGSDWEPPGLLYLRGGGKRAAGARARGRSPARLWRAGPDPVGVGADDAGGTDAAESIDAAGGSDAGDSTGVAEITDAANTRGLVASVARTYNQVSDQMYQLLQLQLLQLHQAIRSQNLQFPPLPNMKPLPDYQAALRQITTMIGAYTAGSEEGESTARAAREKQWVAEDMPPPAYDELFPQNRDLETKQASAAQAAAEAEADAKCAALYDPVSPAITTASGGAKVEEEEEEEEQQEHGPAREPPAVLQLGRKGAITPEQQAAFRWRRAENLKRLNWDLKLFFFWIPTLTIMVSVMIYTGIPGLAANRNWAPWPGRATPRGILMAGVRVARETNIPSTA